MNISSKENSIIFIDNDYSMLLPKESIMLLYDKNTESIDINLKNGYTIINLNYQIVETPSVSSSEELFNELSKLIN